MWMTLFCCWHHNKIIELNMVQVAQFDFIKLLLFLVVFRTVSDDLFISKSSIKIQCYRHYTIRTNSNAYYILFKNLTCCCFKISFDWIWNIFDVFVAKTIFVTCTFYIICTSITKQFQQGRRHISKAGSLISNLKNI